MRNTQFTVDHGSKKPIFSTVANAAGSGAGQSLHPCIQPQSPSTAQSPPPWWETIWKLTTDIFQVDYKCWKTEFTLISMSFSKIQIWISFPSFLLWYNTFHLLPHKPCVFACLHGILTDIDVSVVLSLDWRKDCGSFQTEHCGAYRVRQWIETPLLAVAGLTAGKFHLKWHSITQGTTKEEVT